MMYLILRRGLCPPLERLSRNNDNDEERIEYD